MSENASQNLRLSRIKLGGMPLKIAQIAYLIISIIIIVGAAMFASKLIGAVGTKEYLGMALTALTMQIGEQSFSNGTLAALSALMVIYGLLSLTMRRRMLYLYDFIVILGIIFTIFDNQITMFFKGLWVWILVLWVIHRLVLGLLVTKRGVK